MQCKECGKDFRRAKEHQEFCSNDCRYRYHNRKKRDAAKDAKDERYRAELAAHEARLNGYTLLELKANPPAQLTGPKLIRRLIVVQPKSDEEKQQVAS